MAWARRIGLGQARSTIRLVQFLHQQPHQSGKHCCECRQNERDTLGLAYFEQWFGNVVVNMTGLEQLHQDKGNDKANRSPLEASQS